MMAEPARNEAEILDEALESAGQAVFSAAAAEFPLLRVEELLHAVQGPAVKAVLAARLEQIVKNGHDREHDELEPIYKLPRLVREFAAAAVDCIETEPDRQNLEVARRRLVRAAAAALAAVDRLDPVIAAQQAKAGNR